MQSRSCDAARLKPIGLQPRSQVQWPVGAPGKCVHVQTPQIVSLMHSAPETHPGPSWPLESGASGIVLSSSSVTSEPASRE